MSIPDPGKISRWWWPAVATITVAAVTLAVAVLVSPYRNVVAGSPRAQIATATFPAQSSSELSIAVPMLPGWSIVPIGSSGQDYPSDRGIVANPALLERGYVPTLIVTVDRSEGRAGPQYAVELAAKLDKLATVHALTTREVCGLPAHITEFTGLGAGAGPGTQSGTAITIVPEGGEHAYIVVLQTRNADNPGYVRQRDEVLSGFCLDD